MTPFTVTKEIKSYTFKHYNSEKIDDDDLKHTTTHAALTEHADKLGEVQKSVSTLHEKVELVSSPMNDELLKEIKALTQRVSTFEKELSDIKAITSATKSIMEKILDVNRKTLTELKK